ncbi:putative pyridoxal phosphate-dependent enzyme [Lysobacter silvestris]|uniref:Putative pyridoxal phosphate-dependent enzyme n=2 Tax=Solilutibacter silvestris TaxID=1645665 RepID=A0A2K1PX20_9GAMM|nr:putative pyridoxal phosphate-dependent enzyme [Lysobacter silvestris]
MEVTSSYLPSLQKYVGYLEGIYARCRLTNNGPLACELAARLEDYLGVRNLILVSNGSAALELAYHALDISGSVVTTPFSFPASSSVPAWNGIDPSFADIDPHTWNIDPDQIESAIRSDTTAISPVHVYGNPVDDVRVSAIARRHGLRVIYDAAHCFGTRKAGRSILDQGDASAISFHATKTFHTIEGGAVIFRDDAICERARRMINFGFDAVTGDIVDLGTNLKMSEVHAAMGLAVLDDVDYILSHRRHLLALYMHKLGDYVQCQRIDAEVTNGGGYMPIALADTATCERVYQHLGNLGIATRRYFHPSLDTTVPYARFGTTRYSRDIADRVLCLPLHTKLSPNDVETVCTAVLAGIRDTAPRLVSLAGIV